jgi:hypothetical protein
MLVISSQGQVLCMQSRYLIATPHIIVPLQGCTTLPRMVNYVAAVVSCI